MAPSPLTMLLPLMWAVLHLTGAQQMVSSSSQLDISACPITFYGKTYRQFYVNFTSENFVVCFGAFYSPGGTGDCILAPPPDSQRASLEVYQRIPILEMILHRNLPSIQRRMDCFAGFSLQHGGQSTSLALVSFGRLSALYLYTTAAGTVVSENLREDLDLLLLPFMTGETFLGQNPAEHQNQNPGQTLWSV